MEDGKCHKVYSDGSYIKEIDKAGYCIVILNEREKREFTGSNKTEKHIQNYEIYALAKAVEIMENEKLLDNAKNIGDYLIDELAKLPGIKEIRGRGLMIGIEFEGSIKEIRSRLLFEEKVFTGVAGTNTIRLLPPLCLTLEEAKDFMQRFKRVLGLQNN